jgi:hypothetical protein
VSSTERWRRIEDICQAALERDPAERPAFVKAACGDDAALRREVATLLAREPRAGGFLERSALEAAAFNHVGTGGVRESPIGRRLGSYDVVSALGAGGMGEVYRARDARLGRDVAIKVLPAAVTADKERLARFEREARVLASLNHPHIGAIYGVEDIDGVPALILELVEGETLGERLANGVSLSVDNILTIARQIAEALEAAHAQGIIHRDVKPANIKITPAGIVKVLDFGIAKAAGGSAGGDGASTPTITATAVHEGAMIGTAAYMSPEQARGQVIDKRTDIWAFGCVLYEMLCGRMAFPGRTVSDHIAAVLEREPDWSALPAATPVMLRHLLRWCLQKDPSRRLHDIADARVQIDSLLTTAPAETSAAAVVTRPVSLWRQAVPWSLVVVAVAGAALAVWAPWRRALPSPAPVRVRAELGANVAPLTGNRGAMVNLSRDGAVVMFVGEESASGIRRVYLRRLDQLAATPVSGTDGAEGVFFSPDGQWIGFFAGGKLKKVSVLGGAVVTLADAPIHKGGAWGEDGTIVYMPGQPVGFNLFRVSSAGGKPEALTTLAQGELTHRWPQTLPGDTGVLYTSSTDLDDYNGSNLVVQPLPAGRGKIVLRGGYHGRYLASGHLAYVNSGTLFVVAFDLDRLEVIGEPVPVLEDVRHNPTTGNVHYAVSASGTLVYLPAEHRGDAVPMHWMGQDGHTTPLLTTAANWFNPQFAPDGRRIALQILASHTDIWVYEWARDTLTRLTAEPANDSKPVWTPDGRRIAFASKTPFNLYWRQADGTGESQRLTESPHTQRPASWHPNGKLLAFEEQHPQTNWDLMILPIDGDEVSGWRPGTPSVFLNGAEVEQEPMFSPDGRWLAYSSLETGQAEVYVRPFPGPGGKWQISNGGATHPTWSRTKPELFYRSGQHIMVAPYAIEAGSFVAKKPRVWSERRLLFRGERGFDLHPDGERVAVLPDTDGQDGAKRDTAVFIVNFFDELRRIAPTASR